MSRLRRAMVVSLSASLLLAACGGGSTPAATPGGDGSAAPVAAETQAGGATTAPDGAAASGAISLGNAASALNDLDNYRFRIGMSSTGTADFVGVPNGGSLVMDGAVIFRPEPQAAEIVMTTKGGSADGALSMRIIGDKSYVNMGGDQWIESGATDGASQINAYRPDSLLGSYAGVQGLQKVGEEDKNGIAADHYQSTQDMGYAAMFGLPDGKWVMDVWIAKDGGFVVATQATAEAKEGAETGSFTMTVDVVGANDPTLKIEVPDNIMEIPS
jgi:hypothetical protein